VVPASLTVTSTLAGASTVVTEFGNLIILVAALAIGVFAVRFLIGRIKSAVQ